MNPIHQLPIDADVARFIAEQAINLYLECRGQHGMDASQAFAETVATVAEGASTPADPAADPPDVHPATAAARVRAVVEAYRDDPRYTELANRVPLFTAPGAPLYLADLRALLGDRPPAARSMSRRATGPNA